jgi:hypothetical protein
MAIENSIRSTYGKKMKRIVTYISFAALITIAHADQFDDYFKRREEDIAQTKLKIVCDTALAIQERHTTEFYAKNSYQLRPDINVLRMQIEETINMRLRPTQQDNGLAYIFAGIGAAYSLYMTSNILDNYAYWRRLQGGDLLGMVSIVAINCFSYFLIRESKKKRSCQNAFKQAMDNLSETMLYDKMPNQIIKTYYDTVIKALNNAFPSVAQQLKNDKNQLLRAICY